LRDETNDRWTAGTNNIVAGTFIGNLTGNTSGTAATVTGGAQTSITSLGTLTGLTVSSGSSSTTSTISADRNAYLNITATDVNNNGLAKITLSAGNAADSSSYSAIQYQNPNYSSTAGNRLLFLRGSGATVLTLDGSGNGTFSGDVGIGGSPSYPLHITKADTGSGASAVFISSTMTATGGSQSLQGIKLEPTFADGSQSTIAARALYINPTFSGIDTEIGLYVDNGMTILDGGNVGIGTSAPTNALSVEKTVSNDWLAEFKQGDSTAGESYGVSILGGTNASDVAFDVGNQAATVLFRVRGDGNVGIGTTAPDNLVHIHKASAGSITADANLDLVIEDDSDTGIQILNPK
jgi:hypothetical protein